MYIRETYLGHIYNYDNIELLISTNPNSCSQIIINTKTLKKKFPWIFRYEILALFDSAEIKDNTVFCITIIPGVLNPKGLVRKRLTGSVIDCLLSKIQISSYISVEIQK